MRSRIMWAMGVIMIVSMGWAVESKVPDPERLLPEARDLLEGVPGDFPRFFLGDHEEEAQWLSRYLWYHFRNRMGYGKTLFNQEYVTTSDMWMGGAVRPDWGRPVQQIHREMLLAITVDEDGYVSTHQHFSHAHEQGWPFPMWINSLTGQQGVAAGWHFQNDGPGWVWDYNLRQNPDSPFGREKALAGWDLENVRSQGIVENKWRLESTGDSPKITIPGNVGIEAFDAPYLQLRWTRSQAAPAGVLPYVEWLREGDEEFSPERRVYFRYASGNRDYESVSGSTHSMITMYSHPLWQGRIKRIRIALAPGESNVIFSIDSFFTVYDTRHTINNPIYILACWNYFRWTGDVEFLGSVVNKMRLALRYQQTVLGGMKYNHIRNPWPGHDGLSGFTVNPDGSKQVNYGHGIGSNYWDILPFGWDDMYATNQYYASTEAMANVEELVQGHPEWGISRGAMGLDPEELRLHAAQVKQTANQKFWDREKGRFIGCVDQNGQGHDYGFTFLNLDAVWYGIADEENGRAIVDWLSGKRIVAGDTSTGADIYHWRFGPRATTQRNIEWYGFTWTGPETIPWGGQVQDGGAVLGFSFYDMYARLQVKDAESAWGRLVEILRWEKEVWSEGGYRAYYEGGKRGITLQGGGTAGGVGIDAEFFESSLIPSIVVYGFLGMEPDGARLRIMPKLPDSCPQMGVSNILYRNVRLDVKASKEVLVIGMADKPLEPVCIELEEFRRLAGSQQRGPVFTLMEPGIYHFRK